MAKLNGVDILVNDKRDAYAVLVSGSFGAGWSTWNDPRIGYDKRVVEFYMARYGAEDLTSEEIKQFLTNCGYKNTYIGGWDGLQIVWVPLGRFWKMTEYDGAEGIDVFDPTKWNCVHGRDIQ